MTTKKKSSRARRAGVSLLMLKSREIGAAEFKAHCLELMDEVERLGIEITITKHRKPVACLVPARPSASSFVGSMRGSALVIGDIIGPTGEEWEADDSNLT